MPAWAVTSSNKSSGPAGIGGVTASAADDGRGTPGGRGPGGLSFDGDGDQRQAQADRRNGGDYADGTFAFHKVIRDAPGRWRPAPGLEWQKAGS